jgi:DNA adenine methylase
MAYVGSKAKGAEHILEVLNDPIFDGMHYVEAFCGYCHILRRIENKKSYRVSDCNPLLITLLKAVQKKQKLPTITEDEYHTLKYQNANTLKRAVAAFTYSYCGKEFGGYVDKYIRDGKKRSYSAERKRYYQELQTNEQFMSSNIRCIDYRKLHYKNKLIYCDPPYANTTGYKNGGHDNDFDSNEFWDLMRKWSADNYVFISEYKAPTDFKCVTSAMKQSSLAIEGRTIRKEKLFVHKSVYDKLSKLIQT